MDDQGDFGYSTLSERETENDSHENTPNAHPHPITIEEKKTSYHTFSQQQLENVNKLNYQHIQEFQASKNPCIINLQKMHKHLALSNYICIARVLVISFIYYFQAYTITHDVVYPIDVISYNPQRVPVHYQTNIERQLIQPWNLMIYFLSATVDIIYLIGHIGAIRTIKKDKLIAYMLIGKQQEFINQCQKQISNLKQNISNSQKVNREQIDKEIDKKYQKLMQQREKQEQNLIAPQSIQQFKVAPYYNGNKYIYYKSFYSTILGYKYQYRDLASPFKMGQIMHISITFIIFGSLAMYKQGQLQPHQSSPSNQTIYTSWFWSGFRQLILWSYLLSAYIHSFQLDLYKISTSSGPYLKIKNFHWTKIKMAYDFFCQWRQKYHLHLNVSMFIGLFVIFMGIIHNIIYAFSDELEQIMHPFVFIVQLFIIILVHQIRKMNKSIIETARQRGTANFTILNNEEVQQFDDIKWFKYVRNFNDKITCRRQKRKSNTLYEQKINIDELVFHPNLSMYGILNSITIKSYHKIHYLESALRISIVCLLLAYARNPAPSSIILLCNYVFLIFVIYTEHSKWQSGIKKQNYSLLSSFKYDQLIKMRNRRNKQRKQSENELIEQQGDKMGNEQKNRQQIEDMKDNKNQMIQHGQDECGICLMEYSVDDSVIMLFCGHLFHEECLQCWIKQKEECPLDRSPIQQCMNF